MGRVRSFVSRLVRHPLVHRARQAAETFVTPRVRADLANQHARVLHTENQLGTVVPTLHEIESHLPRLLNAISSSDGAARMLRRDLDDLRRQLDDLVEAFESQTLADDLETASRSVWELTQSVRAHADTQRWLLERVEMIRSEMLHEVRYGKADTSDLDGTAGVEVLLPGALEPADGQLRLNLGCGHKPLPGYANVDLRRLPGVDIVAPVDALPVEPASVAEIHSAHMLEHFPEEQLRRTLLPYWVGLLRPGGTFRAVVPDLDAMTKAYVAGELGFETLRLVTYGGQEYEGDTHFTGFTVEHLTAMLERAGLTEVEVIASGRPDGDGLELELTATRAG